ncbi:MAG: hypothetical protein ACI9CO_000289 [Candidatus Azotimanducaceae bacterium]|jgi:hypothetical protein
MFSYVQVTAQIESASLKPHCPLGPPIAFVENTTQNSI